MGTRFNALLARFALPALLLGTLGALGGLPAAESRAEPPAAAPAAAPAPAGAAETDGPMCALAPSPTPEVIAAEALEQIRHMQGAGDGALMLNTRGYNYGPGPGGLEAGALQFEAGRRR